MTIPFLHPTARELQRFADGELRPYVQSRVARHLADCARCRGAVSFSRSLAHSLQSLTDAALSPALIERVISERASGARAILPSAEPTSHRRLRPIVWVVGGTAAAVALFLAPIFRDSHRERQAARVRPDTAFTPDYLGSFLSGSEVFAAQPSPLVRELPPAHLSGASFRPMHLEYARLLQERNGTTRMLGRGSLDIAAARIEDRDAWRIIQLWRSADTIQAETLHVDRSSLRLLGRVVRVTPYRRYHGITIRQRMYGDSLVGWMNTDEGLGRPIARHLLPAFSPYVSDAMAPVVLLGAQLTALWKGEVSLLGWAVRSNDVFAPVTLAVEGEERITVPAGSFDCWRIALGVFGQRKTYWVRKSDGLGIRTRDTTSDARGPQDFVLTRE
ncbi:MAG TPA: zf-HC2 domain-containing protein [Gemmatimonadaceae bacterium]|nr:zf-HC2 domain-containing protein [Gemmatimonadaceae bacterium]